MRSAYVGDGRFTSQRMGNTTSRNSDPWYDGGGERSASAVVWVTEDLRVESAIYEGDAAVLECAEKVRELACAFSIVEVVHDPWRFQQVALELAREAHGRPAAAEREPHDPGLRAPVPSRDRAPGHSLTRTIPFSTATCLCAACPSRSQSGGSTRRTVLSSKPNLPRGFAAPCRAWQWRAWRGTIPSGWVRLGGALAIPTDLALIGPEGNDRMSATHELSRRRDDRHP